MYHKAPITHFFCFVYFCNRQAPLICLIVLILSDLFTHTVLYTNCRIIKKRKKKKMLRDAFYKQTFIEIFMMLLYAYMYMV